MGSHLIWMIFALYEFGLSHLLCLYLFQQIFIKNFLHVSHLGKTVGDELHRIPSQHSSYFKDRII